jgi:hypothetical protein
MGALLIPWKPNSQAGMLTVACSTAAPGTYSPLGVAATDQYGAHAASVYQLVVQAQKVYVPGNYGDEVNPFGNGFDVYHQRAAYNTMIVAWTAAKADPAAHFIREQGHPGWRGPVRVRAPRRGGRAVLVGPRL